MSDALVDETRFTKHGEPGWSAWNHMSPELEVCRFAGMLQRMLAPAVVVETGVGQGKVTDELDLSASLWLGFESDPQWRRRDCQDSQTPTSKQMAAADLVILDSDPQFRLPEIDMWAECGQPGSVCLVHDAGNGHPGGSGHDRIRQSVLGTGIGGAFLANPRGAWLAIHP